VGTASLAAIELGALLEAAAAALLAGVGLTALFSIVIYCTTRADELRRDGSLVLASVLGLVAVLGVLTCLGGVVFGIKVMTDK
jgi:hypothetical protein